MRNRIAAGNWKMNKTLPEALSLVAALDDVAVPATTDVILAVPNIYLLEVKRKVSNSRIKVAAQNCHEKPSGAVTGEVSAEMLRSLDIDAVIIGHSERRALFHETDEQLAAKTDSVLAQGMMVIFCCGESLEIRNAGEHVNHVKDQLRNGLFHLAVDQLTQVVIAYEPIWAIGTGVTASPEQAQEMHREIRAMVQEKYGDQASEKMQILYGGSVKPSNASELFNQDDVDGGLVGGASLKAEDFAAIIQA